MGHNKGGQCKCCDPFSCAGELSLCPMQRCLSVSRVSRTLSKVICDTRAKVSLNDRFTFCLSPCTTHIEWNFLSPNSSFITKCTHMPGRICVLDGMSDLSISFHVFISSSFVSL